MTISLNYLKNFDLQLFAESGAAAGAGAGVGGTGSDGATGVTATAAVSQETGRNNGTPVAGEQTMRADPAIDRNAEFEKLIKGDYKDLYDAKVRDTVQNRLKGTKETVEKYEALSPVLEMLGERYGVDASDIEALQAAMEEDDSYYEEEALAEGKSVEEVREQHKLARKMRAIEKENETLRERERTRETQEKAAQIYAGWMREAESIKTVYPSFNLDSELQNSQFTSLLRSGIDVKTAFEVIHKDEILPAAMQYTAKTVEKQVVNRIKANGSRPVEGATRSQGASLVKGDVSQLTKAQRAEINRKVMQGERFTFG